MNNNHRVFNARECSRAQLIDGILGARHGFRLLQAAYASA